MTTLLIAVLVFGILILAHELGHFLAAKTAGIRVIEFSIGMGPSIFAFKGKETLYSLRLFPIGGFNRMAGMEPGEDDGERGFNKQPLLSKMGVVLAGSTMNFILALLLFIIVFMVLGIPSQSPLVGKIVPDSPAEVAGLREGDRILAVNGQKINSWDQLLNSIQKKAEKKVNFLVARKGQKINLQITPQKDPETGNSMIGIWRAWEKRGLIDSIVMGVKQAIGVGVLLVSTLVQMITGKIAPNVAGPVGIVQLVGEAAKLGVVSVLNFTAILSLNLGLINLFPIPALDGSRLVFLGLEGILGRPVNPEKENFIHLIGFAFLITIMLIITYQDILRLLQ